DELARGMAWEGAPGSVIRDRGAAIAPSSEPRAPDAGSRAVRVWQSLPIGTAIYGLGEKTGPLDKRGGADTMWNTDALYGPGQDPLYMSIPFFIAAHDGIYHGVFFDNPWRSSFDLEKESRETMSFGAEGGELNYYVIEGPAPKEVVQRYTDFTGRIE